MKCELAVCVVLVAIAGLQAAPQWIRLTPAASLDKGVGEIYTYCNTTADNDNSRVVINSVTINPDPPQSGKDVTITADFFLKEAISANGTVTYDIKVPILPDIKGTMTLGEAAQKAGVAITFPIPVGDHKMSFTQAVPSIGILKVTVKGHVTVADGKGAQLGCIDIDFKI